MEKFIRYLGKKRIGNTKQRSFQSQTAKSTQDVKISHGVCLWSDAVARMVDATGLKHLSRRTEQTYLGWMRQFYRFVKAVAPEDSNSRHVTEFLTYLGVARKATQDPVFNAVLFFFGHVIKQDISNLRK